MPIYKRCSRCGRRIPAGTKCICQKVRHKEYDRYSRDKKSKGFYDSREWGIARDAALEADGGMDVYVYMTTGEIKGADTAHHIVPLKDDWERRADVDNLMSLHHDTHSEIEQMYRRDKAGTVKNMQELLKQFRQLRRAGGI